MKEYISGEKLENYLFKKTLRELLDSLEAAVESTCLMTGDSFENEQFKFYPGDVKDFILDNFSENTDDF